MFPTEDQVRFAAFERWRRRGCGHGFDRDDWFAAQDELTFSLNYQTIVEYPLDVPGTLILSDRPARYCRFCERTAMQVAFGRARPVVDGGRESSLFTEAICNDCQSTFRDALADEFRRFQASLPGAASEGRAVNPIAASPQYSLDVFKSLVACALTIMPESELRYFVDALEWVSNPGPNCDAPLLREESTCLVYSADFLRDQSWTSLARRTAEQCSVSVHDLLSGPGGRCAPGATSVVHPRSGPRRPLGTNSPALVHVAGRPAVRADEGPRVTASPPSKLKPYATSDNCRVRYCGPCLRLRPLVRVRETHFEV